MSSAGNRRSGTIGHGSWARDHQSAIRGAVDRELSRKRWGEIWVRCRAVVGDRYAGMASRGFFEGMGLRILMRVEAATIILLLTY